MESINTTDFLICSYKAFMSSIDIKELKFLTITGDSKGDDGVFAIQPGNIILALLIKTCFSPLI